MKNIITLLLFFFSVSFAQVEKNIAVYRGDSTAIEFKVNGNITNKGIVFVVKLTKSFSSPRLIQKSNLIAGGSAAEITASFSAPQTKVTVYLGPEDTEDLEATTYYYDIIAADGSNLASYQTFNFGKFTFINGGDVQTPFDGTTPPTSGVRFYVAGTFIDSTVADSTLFRYDKTTHSIVPIAKEDVWEFFNLDDSVHNKIDSVFLGYEDTTIYVVNDSAGIDLAINSAIEAEKQYPNGLIALDSLYKIMTRDIIFENYQKDYIAQSVDTLQVDVLANASHINTLADSLRNEMKDQDTIDVEILNPTKIIQAQRTGFTAQKINKIGTTELQNGINTNINLRWSDNTAEYFNDTLKVLNLFPESNFAYIDSLQPFVPRWNSAYHLDGWKYAYGYNKRGGVTIRIDNARTDGSAERVIAIFEKYGARAFYVIQTSELYSNNADFYKEITNRGHEVATHSYSYANTNFTIDSVGGLPYKLTSVDYDGDTFSFTTDTIGTDSTAKFDKIRYSRYGLNHPAYSDLTFGGDLFYSHQKGTGYVAKNNQYESSKGATTDLAYGNPSQGRYGLTGWDVQLQGLEVGENGNGKTMIFDVADAVAKHFVIGDHIHDINTGNQTVAMERLDSLLKFCFENQILVTGITDWVHITLDMPTNPYINIAPQFYTDLNNDGLSDGWDLSGSLTTADRHTDDGYESDCAWELNQSSSDQLHCGVTGKKLYGWEEGTNLIGLAVKGISDYDSVYVVIAGTNKDGLFTETIAMPVTSSWTFVTSDFYNTVSDKTTGIGRSRSIKIYPKNGVIRVSAPLIRKKW